MPYLGSTIWDNAQARLLYDQNLSYNEIARRVGTSSSQVSSFAARHWPKRDDSLVIRKRSQGFPTGANGPRAPRVRQLKPGESTLPPLASLEEG